LIFISRFLETRATFHTQACSYCFAHLTVQRTTLRISRTSSYTLAILWQRGTSTDTSFQIWDKFKEFFVHLRGTLSSDINLKESCVLYIGRAHRYPLNTPFYIFFQQIHVLSFLNMLHTLLFFSLSLFKMPFIS
jgi:hypothetical protein